AGHAGTNVESSVVVDAHAVGIAAFKGRELPEVAQRAVGLDVERVDRGSIGRIEHAAVRTQGNAVRPLDFLAYRHRLAVRADVDNPLLRTGRRRGPEPAVQRIAEVEAALLVGDDVVRR